MSGSTSQAVSPGRSSDGELADDRRVFRIVARREFIERARDRSYLFSTLITMVILVGFIVVNGVLDHGPESFDLGAVGSPSVGLAREVAAEATSAGVTVRVRELPDRPAADQALRAGDVDLVVVDGSSLVARSEPPADLLALVQSASAGARIRAALGRAGLDPDQVEAASSPPPLPIATLEPPDPHRGANSAVAFVGVLLLYGQLLGYGYWVAAGVVEEKASRVVEVLLSTIRPSQLLAGKILGIGLLGLLQLVLVGVVAVVTAEVVGVLDFPSTALATAGLVLAWFVLGYAFYSSVFAAAGSLVSRQEDLQAALTPLTLVILGSFFIGIGALSNPGSSLARVASLLPPSAPLIMPTRIVLGEAAVWEVVVSIGVSLAAIALLIPLGGRLYSGAILRTGKVKLREAWRAEA